MKRTFYALLVGIDEYQYPVAPLRGCVNDIMAFEQFLRERAAEAAEHVNIRVLKNAEATRQAVIDGFREHLSQAGEDDVALFYYSGHGAQQHSPQEFWHLEPDRLDETLVCYDSRQPGHYDLADKELAKLIAEVATRSPHILVILDCCHSGSGTRDDPDRDVRIRRASTDTRLRSIESFIVTLDEANRLSSEQSREQSKGHWIDVPYGKHIVISACRDDETAKELPIEGNQRGVCSYYLLDTLQHAGRQLTYRDLFKRLDVMVQNRVRGQSPQIEAREARELDQPFLGGVITTQRSYFTLGYRTEIGWTIDGGALHGVSPIVGEETTLLAIFSINSTAAPLSDLDMALGTARIVEVLPHLSVVTVEFEQHQAPDEEQTYKAVVIRSPLPRLGVLLEGDEEGIALVRNALATAELAQRPSLYVREATTIEDARLRVSAQDATYHITQPTEAASLVTDIAGYNAEHARRVVQRLEHIARWIMASELANPSSRLSPDAVQLEVHRIVGPPASRQPGSEPTEAYPADSEVLLEYQYVRGKWQKPTCKIRLVNTSSEPLYCALLYLSEDYSIDASSLVPGGTVGLDPGQETWAYRGKPIPVGIPDSEWEQGVTEHRDLIKLIVSTAHFDATLLEQEELDIPLRPTSVRGETRNNLTQLLGRIRSRKLMPDDERQQYTDWNTSEIRLTVVRPRDSATISKAHAIDLEAGITVEAHPDLQANVRLTSAAQMGRDLGSLIEPALLRDNPDVVQPLEFTTSRGSNPGLSGLELYNVADHTVITPEHPLVIRVPAPETREVNAVAEEHVLPIGYDGEFFLPLGRAIKREGAIEIALERLPAPLSFPIAGERSLTGSIRIMFKKILHRPLGLRYAYPILAVADVAADGTVDYIADSDKVASRVAAANRIVLYIHGIIGDTRDMAASVRCPGFPAEAAPPALADNYDLILTFDYENINTRIQDTAQLLKERLQALGLGEGHGKTLHIIAHSMGGLVSRWFIENLGGNQSVQHLIMLGTPNDGSPWPRLQDWATATLAIGLNALPVLGWPANVLGVLVGAIEKADVALDQMAPGSDFLVDLSRSPAPGIPYTIIAGNTSIISAALQSPEGAEQSIAARLMKRVLSQNTLHQLTDMAFFGEPNDIAVKVESITKVSGERSVAPSVYEVECDHLTYFSSEAGIRALQESIV